MLAVVEHDQRLLMSKEVGQHSYHRPGTVRTEPDSRQNRHRDRSYD